MQPKEGREGESSVEAIMARDQWEELGEERQSALIHKMIELNEDAAKSKNEWLSLLGQRLEGWILAKILLELWVEIAKAAALNRVDPEDLRQQVFLVLKTRGALTQYDSQHATPQKYIKRAIYNQAIDMGRQRSSLKRKERSMSDLPEEDVILELLAGKRSAQAAAAEAAEREYFAVIMQDMPTMLQQLLASERDVVEVLLSQENVKYGDIARQLGIPEGTVKSRLFAAKRKLAPIIQNQPQFKILREMLGLEEKDNS